MPLQLTPSVLQYNSSHLHETTLYKAIIHSLQLLVLAVTFYCLIVILQGENDSLYDEQLVFSNQLIMTNSKANVLKSIAKPVAKASNSIAKASASVTNYTAKPMNSTANRTKSTAKVTNSIAKPVV